MWERNESLNPWMLWMPGYLKSGSWDIMSSAYSLFYSDISESHRHCLNSLDRNSSFKRKKSMLVNFSLVRIISQPRLLTVTVTLLFGWLLTGRVVWNKTLQSIKHHTPSYSPPSSVAHLDCLWRCGSPVSYSPKSGVLNKVKTSYQNVMTVSHNNVMTKGTF